MVAVASYKILKICYIFILTSNISHVTYQAIQKQLFLIPGGFEDLSFGGRLRIVHSAKRLRVRHFPKSSWETMTSKRKEPYSLAHKFHFPCNGSMKLNIFSICSIRLQNRGLRYYRIGIETTILLSQCIVSVSYQYQNSKLEKYQYWYRYRNFRY